MKRLAIPGLIALSVLLALACSLTSGIPTEEIRRRAIAILGDDVEEELVRDFIVVTPPPTFTTVPTSLSCIKPVSFGTYHLSVFNGQSGTADNPQYVFGPPDGQDTNWEGDSDVTRYWSYSLASVISGMITHTLVYTPEDTVSNVDLYVHRERFVSVDEPGWVRVCAGQWSCSFTSEVGSVMYALSGPGGVEVDGAVLELTNGCEYTEAEVIAAANLPTLTPTSTPTATIESSSQSSSTTGSGGGPSGAPTGTAVPVPPLVGATPTLLASPTVPLPTPTVPLPTPTVPLPTPTVPLPTPTVPPPTSTTLPSGGGGGGGGGSTSPTSTPTPVPPVITFSAANYSIAENGGAATITVNLDKTWPVTVTVDYATSDGTAMAGNMDYVSSSGTLSFSPGQTSLSFSVPIIDDETANEPDITVNLTLNNPGIATLGAPNTAILTITDDDVPPTVQFSSANYSVGESAGPATINVILSTSSAMTVTVDYATSDGTATAGSDYTDTSGTLNFLPFQTSLSFNVPILDDGIVEGDETVRLALSNPGNATLGVPNTAVLTIVEDDVPTVQFSSATYSVNEFAGTATITVTLNVAPVVAASVDYVITDGTATAGSDYTNTSGQLQFAVGQTVGTFTIPINNDVNIEQPDETVNLSLNNPFNVTLGTPNTAVLTIIDDDLHLYISDEFSDIVSRYDATTGTFIDAFVPVGSGGLDAAIGLTFGADGNLYVSSWNTNEVLRYDGTTGAPLGTGSCSNPAAFVCAGSGGLVQPVGLVFGPDGNLYVLSQSTDEVLRYNGTTGAVINTFVTSGSGGLNFPWGLVFGPGGDLYISSQFSDQVLRYNGTTGASLGAFITTGSGGLAQPTGLLFGPGGNFYLSSFNTNEVLRYNGTTGAPLGTGACANPDAFVCAGSGGLANPTGIAFGPDGHLYVVSRLNNQVIRYDGTTGAPLGTGACANPDAFVCAGSGGLTHPAELVFRP